MKGQSVPIAWVRIQNRFRVEKSDIVDVDLLVVAELECAFALILAKCLGLVDLGVFWKLTVRFH